MPISREVRESLIRRFRSQGLSLDPALLDRIIDEVADAVASQDVRSAPASPFEVSWMDSFLAHWALGRSVPPAADRFDDVAQLLREAMDMKFEERKADILRWIRGGTELAPDGGPPERGTPPVGPSALQAPDGGPPEPGTPPVGPLTVEPPDGGPPEPGVPPVGPDAGMLRENPWILYWFISLKAPMLLDVIDAHLTRRLGELGFERG